MSSEPLVLQLRENDPGEPPDKGGEVQKQTTEVIGGKATDGARALTFKEKLLEMKEADFKGPEDDDELVENRWHNFQEEEKAFMNQTYEYDPCPEIRVIET